MSFSFSVTIGPEDNIRRAIKTAAREKSATDTNLGVALDNGWIDYATDYIRAIADNVAALNEGESLTIGIYGHANPGVAKNPGWASNAITVSISQVYKEEKNG